jgi:chromosomal replication initiation ATPase DnaA
MEYVTSNTGANIGDTRLVLTITENGIEKKREFTEEEKVNHILGLVSSFFEKSKENVLTGIKREYVQARQVVIYYSWNLTLLSQKEIGRIISGKDHATVIYAIRTVRNLRSIDKKFRKQLEDFESKYRFVFTERIAERSK